MVGNSPLLAQAATRWDVVSPRSKRPRGRGPVLSIWPPNDRVLEFAENLAFGAALCVIPGRLLDITPWVRRTGAQCLVDGFAVVDPPGLPSEVTKSLDGMLSFGGHNSFVGAGEKEDVIHRLRKIAARHDSPSGQQIEDCLRASSFRKGDFPVMALPRDEIPLGLDVAIEFDGHLKTLGCFHGDIPGQLTRPPDVPGDRIIVAATDAGWVDAIAGNLATMAGLGTSTGVTVERSQSLLDARGAVADEVARRDRESVLVILAAATALACVVVFTGTIAGRRDFGRRRALGASQRQLTILVMLTTLWPSLIGAVIGTALGSVYLGSLLGHAPDWRFPVSVGVLTVIALVCSSAPPAAVAATRDPLRVLRVP